MSKVNLAVTSFLASLALVPSLARASFDYRAKADPTPVYRGEALEPPPLLTLSQGTHVTLLLRGPDHSLVRTQGGARGWVRNADLEAVRVSDGATFSLGSVQVTGGGEVAVSPVIPGMEDALPTVASPERSFTGEIVEALDREQTEMRHDEN